MDGGRADLEGRVALLESALKDVSARLAALEGRPAPLEVRPAAALAAAAPTVAAAPAPAVPEAAEEGAPVANALTLAGRSFLVLGGALPPEDRHGGRAGARRRRVRSSASRTRSPGSLRPCATGGAGPA